MRLRRNSTSGGLLSEGARSSVRSVAQVLLGSSRFSIPMSPTCWGGLSRELPLLVGSVARWVSVLSSRYLVLRAVDPGPFCGHDVIDASFAGGRTMCGLGHAPVRPIVPYTTRKVPRAHV